MKKIVFVVQRYGEDVNGGAELHCRQLVERVQGKADLTVLTSCAKDHFSWRNEYEEGESNLNGVRVLRFPVDFERDAAEFEELSRRAFADKGDLDLGSEWMRAQGPYSTALIDYVEQNSAEFDAIVFFTYLYAGTFFGMQKVHGSKVFLIPTAHDEEPIYLDIFKEVFERPDGVIFNSLEEKGFVEGRFGDLPSIVTGAGVDFPDGYDPDIDGFLKKYGVSDYLLYIGRIEEGKGCGDLFENFLKYKKEYPSDLKLVLIGKENMEIPDSKDIVSLGFLSDSDKFDSIYGSKFVVIPSRYESLSLILLEAFKCGKPVLVNGKSDVLKAHCLRSNGGLFYSDYFEFLESMNFLMNNQNLLMDLGENGRNYVEENYNWDDIVEKNLKFILS